MRPILQQEECRWKHTCRTLASSLWSEQRCSLDVVHEAHDVAILWRVARGSAQIESHGLLLIHFLVLPSPLKEKLLAILIEVGC